MRGSSTCPQHEHSITLKQGTNPINVRPYRYPRGMKLKAYKGDAASRYYPTLHQCIFESRVISEKKDGSWRFCIDYKALNKATVSHKFSIPVFEELLDELHGSTRFE